MPSQFLLQIIDRDSDQVIKLEPGGRVEREIVADLTKRILDKPIGLFSTRTQVAKIVEDCFNELILELKKQI